MQLYKLLQLITLYPQHIETEDNKIFFPIMNYFTARKSDKILQKFYNFDKNMIHKYYSALVEKQEKKESIIHQRDPYHQYKKFIRRVAILTITKRRTNNQVPPYAFE